MKKILLVASDKNELKGFGDEFVRTVCGVGPILSAARASYEIGKNGADAVFSIGSCGSTGRLKKGEVISFSSVVTPDQNLKDLRLALGSTLSWNRSTVGEIRTSDRKSPYRLLSSGTFRRTLTEEVEFFHPDAVDMEAYGVAVAAECASIPFFAVKVISDIIGDNSTIGDVSYSVREARERLIEVVVQMAQEV